MKTSTLFFAGQLALAVCGLTTGVDADQGCVIYIKWLTCSPNGATYDLEWAGSWTTSQPTVRGFYMPVYCGTTPPVPGTQFSPAGSYGIAAAKVPKKDANGFNLYGVFCWFEWGYYDGNNVWHCVGSTSRAWEPRPAPGCCFAAGTPVLTSKGVKPIEQLAVGDMVVSSPDDAGDSRPVACRVVDVLCRNSQLTEIEVGGHVIRATAEHPFFVKGKEWVQADSLVPGDLLRSDDGRWTEVTSTASSDNQQQPVYNLRLDKATTFYVGDSDWGFSVWVHADCTKCGRPDRMLAYSRLLVSP